MSSGVTKRLSISCESEGERFSRVGGEVRDIMSGVAARVMDGSISLKSSKKANGLAGKINASCRRFIKSQDGAHLVTAEVLLGELKTVVAEVISADVVEKKVSGGRVSRIGG